MNRRELLRELSRVQATWVNRNTAGAGDVDISAEEEQDYLTRISAVFEKAREDGFIATDESSLVERLEKVEVSVVLGSDRNIKITKPTDMDLARLFLAEELAERKVS